MKTDKKLYMHLNTGAIDVYESWYYTNGLGEWEIGDSNAVDLGYVIEVERKEGGGWRAVKPATTSGEIL